MAPACVVTLRGPSGGRYVARGDGAEVAGEVRVPVHVPAKLNQRDSNRKKGFFNFKDSQTLQL